MKSPRLVCRVVALLGIGAGVLAMPALAAPPGATPADEGKRQAVVERLDRMPLLFVPEQLLAEGGTGFVVRGRDVSIWLSQTGLAYRLQKGGAGDSQEAAKSWVLALDLVGATPSQPVGEDLLPTKVSYFKGSRDQWHTGLPSYASVRYPEPWPGIDVVVSGTAGELESTFVVRPGADPAAIRLAYRGATAVRYADDGSLVVDTPLGSITEQAPIAFQEIDGRRVEVTSAFELEEGTEPGRQAYRFRLGEYDPGRELVVDPVTLVYCGYIGGAEGDVPGDIAVDGAGRVYVTGYTRTTGPSFPVTVGPDLSYNSGETDAFVARVNAAGTGLDYSGYIGGSGYDAGAGIAIDDSGNAYVTGDTESTEASFPVAVGPDLTNNGGRDAFVARVNSAGTGFDYCGYIGGSGDERGTGVAVDASGNAYVAGTTNSSEASFPVTVGPDLTANGGQDAFIAKVSSPDAADGRESFVPAAAVAAGAQGAFFQTDLEINNKGTEPASVTVQWLPRGQNNSAPMESESITLAAGQSLRYENVLTELFGLEPDSVGALKLVANTESVIGMSRTYNVPGAKLAGTFGQGLPAIPSDQLIPSAQVKRLIFMSENNDTRANVGCVNGLDTPVHITLELYNGEGTLLTVKTMNLGPWSNNQINRIFGDYAPVNGYVDVSTQTEGAAFYCYGSVLDNLTSDPTTVLPQTTSGATLFIPAVALASGLEGAFFQTDVDLNNAGGTPAQYELGWLPRGVDNSDPIMSDPFTLAAGASVRYENVLAEIFGLEPDQVGALVMEADSEDLLAMSRTYNLPSAKVAGTFGQELPGIPADQMIPTGVKKRIIFMNENDDVRSNVGCQNAGLTPVTVKIELHNSDGERLGTRTMELPPLSNDQATRVFRNHAPISAGYVDVWTDTEGASIYCYGSVLDNLTSDPTTVLPQ